MATLAHALLQCCLLASQKVQKGGSVWKGNETHLNQKEQRVESFSLTWLPESQQQATAQCMLSQCSRIIASSRACSVYLSLPSQPYLLGLHTHRMYSRKIGILYVSKWSFSMTWSIISTIEFFFSLFSRSLVQILLPYQILSCQVLLPPWPRPLTLTTRYNLFSIKPRHTSPWALIRFCSIL